MKNTTRKVQLLLGLVLVFVLLGSRIGYGQVSITAVNTPVTENFNGISTTLASTLPSGWKVTPNVVASTSLPNYTIATALTSLDNSNASKAAIANSGTPSTGGCYILGTNGSYSDISLGALATSTFASDNNYTVQLTNNTGVSMTSFNVSVDVKQFTVNTGTASVKAWYSTNGTTWTAVDGGNASTVTGTAASSFTSPSVINLAGHINSLTAVTNGASFYINFAITSATTNSQLIGIDNFSFTANPVALVSYVTAGSVTAALSGTATSNVTAGSLSIGSGMTYVSATNGVYTGTGATSYSTFANAAAIFSANTGTKNFYEVSVKANTNYSTSLSNINYRIYKANAASPTYYQWYYFVGSSAPTTDAVFTAAIPVTNVPVGNNTGAGGTPYIATGSTTVFTPFSLNVSSISALQAVNPTQTIYLRLYYWGGTTTTTLIGLRGSSATDPIVRITGSVNLLPTATTTSIATYTSTTATFAGSVTSTSGIATTRGVVYGTSTSPTIAGTKTTNAVTASGTTGAYSDVVTGLTANTLYYYRAYVTNAYGTSYGSELSFTTPKPQPTTQTTSASISSINQLTATLNFTAGNGDNRVVVISTNAITAPSDGTSPGTAVTSIAVTTNPQTFNIGSTASGIAITGLSSGTTYNVAIYDYNNTSTQTDYLTSGVTNSTNFTTTSGTTAPTGMSTTTVSSITSSTASSGGNVSTDGGAIISERGVVVKTSAGPTVTDTKFTSAGTTGSFTTSLTGLSPNTTYFYRAFATNSAGTSYGSESSFTTPKAEPSTQASSVTFSSVGFNSATVSWTRPGGNDGCIAVINTSNSFSIADGTTYSASTAYSSGQQVIALGSGTTVNLTGLTAGTTYYVAVYEYNNSSTFIDYLTSTATGNPGNTTLMTSSTVLRFNANSITSSVPAGGVDTLAPTASTNVNTIGIIRGSGLVKAAANQIMGATNVVASSLVTAQTNGHYYQVGIQANSGFSVSLNQLTSKFYRSTTSVPTSFQVYYYVGNSPSASSSGWTACSTAVAYSTGSTATAGYSDVTDLSSISALQGVQNGTNIYIRIYYWGGTATSGTFGLGRSTTSGTGDDVISFSGATSPLPVVTTTSVGTVFGTATATFAGNLTSSNSISTVRGVAYGTSTAPNTTGTKTTNAVSDATTGAYTDNASGLTANTLYYYRAYATNSYGTSYGSELTFTTLKLAPTTQSSLVAFPSTTSSGASVSLTSGNGDGRVVKVNTINSFTAPSNNVDPGTSTTSYTYPGSGEQSFNLGSATSFSLSGLTLGTQYYIRVYEYNNAGTNVLYLTTTATSNPNSVTTPSTSAPTVASTTTATSILATSVSCGGNVSGDGGSAILERGVVIKTSAGPTTSDIKFVTAGTTGSFSSSLTGLTSNTTYFYRAFARNAIGTSYGNELSFTTLKIEPTVQVSSITFSSITTTTATVSWTRGDGDFVIVKIKNGSGITSPTDFTDPGTANAVYGGSGEQVIYIGTGTSVNLTGLVSGDTYYVQAFEFSNSGVNSDYNVNTTSGNSDNFTALAIFVPLALNSTYTQDFNSLGSGTQNTTMTFSQGLTIPGWYVGRNLSGPTYLGSITYNDGTNYTGTVAYNFGSSGSSDRALGSIAIGSADYFYGVILKNTTGVPIGKVRVQCKIEQWRLGGAEALSSIGSNLCYSTGVTTSTLGLEGLVSSSLPSTSSPSSGLIFPLCSGSSYQTNLAFTPIKTSLPVVGSGTASILDGNAAGNYVNFDQEFSLSTVVPDGQYLILRWHDPQGLNSSGGATANDGVGIDDVSLSWKAQVPDLEVSNSSVVLANAASLSFGTAAVSVGSTRNINIKNTGTATMSISNIGISGTNASDFSLSSLSYPYSLSPGSTLSLSVSYNRITANASAVATMTISSDADNYPSFTVDLTGGANLSAATTVTINTQAPSSFYTSALSSATSTQIMSFDVKEDFTDTTVDAIPTRIASMVFRTATGNTIPDLTLGILGAKLVSGSTELTGTVTSSAITFSSIPNTNTTDLGYVRDNATKTFQLRFWINPSASAAVKAVLDNYRVVLSLNVSEVVVSGITSSIASGGTISSGSGRGLLDVIASKTNFIIQPASSVTTFINIRNTAGTSDVAVELTDAQGYRDLDASGTVTLTASAFSLLNGSSTASSGYATFSGLQSLTGGTSVIAATYNSLTGNSISVISTHTSLASGEFRFNQAGSSNLASSSNWESRPSSSYSWQTASALPTSTATAVEILAGKTAILSSSFTVKTLIISAGASLTINSGGNLVIANDANNSYELSVAGTLINNVGSITFTGGAFANFDNGSEYRHVFNGGTIPDATWGSTSTLNIVAQSGGAMPSALNQSFGHVIINATACTTASNLNGGLSTVAGNLTLFPPASVDLIFGGAVTSTMNVTGNVVVFPGSFNLSSNAIGTKTINITGNLTLNNGAFLKATAGSGHVLSLKGNYLDSSSTAYDPTNISQMLFNGTGPQTLKTSRTSSTFGTIAMNNTASLAANQTLTISQNMLVSGLSFTSGSIVTGSNIIDLGTSGTVTGETSGNKVVGKLKSTKTLATNTEISFGGIGLTLNSVNTAAGSTVVVRTTGTGLVGYDASRKSIKRQFSISPAVNSGLNATMNFSYFTDELNGISAISLGLTKSTNGGITWVSQAGSSVNTTSKVITLTGIADFSDWTAEDVNVALPITLTYFSGVADKGINKLAWQTASEINNKGFRVEKSIDGKLFTDIAFVAGNGNSNRILNYSYSDLKGGNAYYRLTQVDFDGKTTPSNIIYVSENDSQTLSVSVQPNPFSEYCFVNLNGLDEAELVTVDVLSMTGSVLKSYAGNVSGVNTWFSGTHSTLNSGVYSLMVRYNGGLKAIRIIKK